ncbi:MAG: carboxylesterase family protein [Pyrinomonadaceae bacterium]
MRRLNRYVIFAIALLVPTIAPAQEREKILSPHTFRNARGETLPYRLFVPQNYDRKKKYPLVVYLHGGGVGDDNLKQINGGNGYLIDFFTQAETQTRHPALVVAPQSSGDGWIETPRVPANPTRQLKLVVELIDSLRRTYSIDGKRLYVAGQSLGGFGTFAIVAEFPQLFAAGVPLCGGADESKVSSMIKTPLWVFHGEKDETVPVDFSRRIVAAMKKAGGSVKYTEYPGAGHNIWLTVLKEPELLSWLFAQHR